MKKLLKINKLLYTGHKSKTTKIGTTLNVLKNDKTLIIHIVIKCMKSITDYYIAKYRY